MKLELTCEIERTNSDIKDIYFQTLPDPGSVIQNPTQ